MSTFISDEKEWRISKSGLSIKEGYSPSRIVAKYAGRIDSLDAVAFQQWLDDAEKICDAHNAMLRAREK